MKAIRVVLADDHPVVRAGIRNELRAAGIEVVGEATDGEEALRLTERLQPDVLVLDVEMPGLAGLEVTCRLQESQPGLPILVLSAYDHNSYVFGLLEAGATGYVLKDEGLETIVMAVRAAARGETWLSPRVAAKVTRRALGREARPVLTPREIDVLRLMALGKTNREIGQELGIAERTVRYYLRNIYDKLGVNTRVEAVVWAVREELVGN
jgi:DNA-binding NarL/FixJ family response regulator